MHWLCLSYCCGGVARRGCCGGVWCCCISVRMVGLNDVDHWDDAIECV